MTLKSGYNLEYPLIHYSTSPWPSAKEDKEDKLKAPEKCVIRSGMGEPKDEDTSTEVYRDLPRSTDENDVQEVLSIHQVDSSGRWV